MLQRSSTGGEGGGNVAEAARFEIRESEHVDKRIAGEGDGNIVAAVFTFPADVARNPPDGGMVEQRGLDDALQDVDEVIVPPDMGQFMREQRFEVLGWYAGKCAYRDEHNRTEPSDHNRSLD